MINLFLPSKDVPQISASPASDIQSSEQLQVRVELFMPKIVLTPSSSPSTSSPTSGSNSQPHSDHRFPKRFILRTSTVLLSNFVLINDPLVPLPIMYKGRLLEKHLEFVEWAEANSVNAKLSEELQRKRHFNPKNGGWTKNILFRFKEPSVALLLSENADFLMEQSKRNEWILSIPSLWVNCDFGPNTWELPLLSDLEIFTSIILKPANCTPSHSGKYIYLIFQCTVFYGSYCLGNCILVEPRTDVALMVDHFQFVQVAQLVNDVSSLLDQIDSGIYICVF